MVMKEIQEAIDDIIKLANEIENLSAINPPVRD